MVLLVVTRVVKGKLGDFLHCRQVSSVIAAGENSSVGTWKTSEFLRENGVSLEFHFDCLLCLGPLLAAGCSF